MRFVFYRFPLLHMSQNAIYQQASLGAGAIC